MSGFVCCVGIRVRRLHLVYAHPVCTQRLQCCRGPQSRGVSAIIGVEQHGGNNTEAKTETGANTANTWGQHGVEVDPPYSAPYRHALECTTVLSDNALHVTRFLGRVLPQWLHVLQRSLKSPSPRKASKALPKDGERFTAFPNPGCAVVRPQASSLLHAFRGARSLLATWPAVRQKPPAGMVWLVWLDIDWRWWLLCSHWFPFVHPLFEDSDVVSHGKPWRTQCRGPSHQPTSCMPKAVTANWGGLLLAQHHTTSNLLYFFWLPKTV